MSNLLNQQNKEKGGDFWQKLNHVGVENVPDVIRDAVHDDVDWNGSAPIDQIVGAEWTDLGFLVATAAFISRSQTRALRLHGRHRKRRDPLGG